MSVQTHIANIVILANSHNPSILSAEWLDKYSIMPGATLKIQVPDVSIMETNSINMIADQNRLQFVVKEFSEEGIKQCQIAAIKYFETLPHLPYQAIGYNFHYFLAERSLPLPINTKLADKDLAELLGVKLTSQGLLVYWQDQEAQCRLSLEAGQYKDKVPEIIFNFHFEPISDCAEAKRHLEKFTLLYFRCRELANLLDSEMGK